MESLWKHNITMPEFPRLESDAETDVLIVGGGIAGILCAYFLKQAGIDCIIAEADRICGGVTENTTAKITVQHGLIYSKLIKDFGEENALRYLRANQTALEKFRQLCREYPCDFEDKSSFVYSLNDREKLDRELSALKKLGVPAEYVQSIPLPFNIAGAVRIDSQAQFHPLKLLKQISKDLKIFENSFVRKIDGGCAFTDRGSITAKKIIVATHFPIINKYGGYFLKLYQHRSYVLALENAPQIDGMYVDEAEKGMSFRNSGKYLLIGGGDHKSGKQGGNWEELRRFRERCFPDSKEKFMWATQDCMSLDSVPYIGRYSGSQPDLYVATGFNKWGMTSSMVSAMLLTDMITGKKNPCAEVFSPQRSMLKPQLLVNGASAVANLLTVSTKRCPHMGCALKWNPAEHSWDCPCHGSRFDRHGKLINNPAMRDMK